MGGLLFTEINECVYKSCYSFVSGRLLGIFVPEMFVACLRESLLGQGGATHSAIHTCRTVLTLVDSSEQKRETLFRA